MSHDQSGGWGGVGVCTAQPFVLFMFPVLECNGLFIRQDWWLVKSQSAPLQRPTLRAPRQPPWPTPPNLRLAELTASTIIHYTGGDGRCLMLLVYFPTSGSKPNTDIRKEEKKKTL